MYVCMLFSGYQGFNVLQAWQAWVRCASTDHGTLASIQDCGTLSMNTYIIHTYMHTLLKINARYRACCFRRRCSAASPCSKSTTTPRTATSACSGNTYIQIHTYIHTYINLHLITVSCLPYRAFSLGNTVVKGTFGPAKKNYDIHVCRWMYVCMYVCMYVICMYM